ncbi:hypothetical protein [Bradyrhizobium sp. CCBAU 51753]|uniref:hypothetical protein n=1 Tax=Bradyrhizobium sp. CCBAU 51753 TaxID=1325100 RepID=UPI00188D4079|nr:hypothetical protein [Bradyrhizobium sp. CCBAU 51753]QOZ23144.1 hypothetical protein XH93_05340 [Bradyrhizobium sp. CCBAU 51753]
MSEPAACFSSGFQWYLAWAPVASGRRAEGQRMALGRRGDALADFRTAQSIDPADQVSKRQLRMFGF